MVSYDHLCDKPMLMGKLKVIRAGLTELKLLLTNAVVDPTPARARAALNILKKISELMGTTRWEVHKTCYLPARKFKLWGSPTGH